MARLIDADALCKRIREIYDGYMLDEGGCRPLDFENMVDEQPTAYDVDAVVEELTKIKGYYGYYGSEECEYVPYLTTVGIVRKGGVNE